MTAVGQWVGRCVCTVRVGGEPWGFGSGNLELGELEGCAPSGWGSNLGSFFFTGGVILGKVLTSEFRFY